MHDLERSEDVGAFEEIQEAANSGQLHSGDMGMYTGCQDPSCA